MIKESVTEIITGRQQNNWPLEINSLYWVEKSISEEGNSMGIKLYMQKHMVI